MGSKPREEKDTVAKKIVTYDPVSDVYDIVIKVSICLTIHLIIIDLFLCHKVK